MNSLERRGRNILRKLALMLNRLGLIDATTVFSYLYIYYVCSPPYFTYQSNSSVLYLLFLGNSLSNISHSSVIRVETVTILMNEQILLSLENFEKAELLTLWSWKGSMRCPGISNACTCTNPSSYPFKLGLRNDVSSESICKPRRNVDTATSSTSLDMVSCFARL